MLKRVRTLLRVSSKQQLKEDDIPIQRAEVEQYIAKQKDWVFDKEYIEKAVSAYKNSVEDREVLLEILQDAKNKEFDVLLTYMSDRIGRKEEYSAYVTTLNTLGIEVWTIKDGQLKTEEPIDRLLNYLRFWQNEGESKKTSTRVSDAQKEMVRQGKFVGGKAPYGYRLVPSGEISNHGRLLKKLEIVEEQAKIVRKIFNYAIYQGMGYERIAKALNAEGVPPVEVGRWRNSTIASILKNPVYMGYYVIYRRKHHDSRIRMDKKDWIFSEKQDEEIVIIPKEEWERAQEIREARRDRIKASKDASSKLYEEQHSVPFRTSGKLALIGFTYCGYCGKRLKNGSYANHWTTKAGENKVSFVGRYNCPEKCPERACYSQDYLESIVYGVVGEYMERLKTVDITKEMKKMQSSQKASIDKELQENKKEQRTLKLDIETLEEKIPEAIRGDYFFSAEKLADIIKEKEQSLKEVKKKQKEIERRLSEVTILQEDMDRFIRMVPNWKAEFEKADLETKKMLLSTMIDRIEVKADSVVIKFKIQLDNFTAPAALETIKNEENFLRESIVTSRENAIDLSKEAKEKKGKKVLATTATTTIPYKPGLG